MKKYIVAICALLLSIAANAQVKGVIHGSDNKSKKPIYRAKVKLLNANRGVYTEEDGKFEIILPKQLPDTMVVTAIGYTPDTVIVTKDDRFISFDITLYSDQLLPEVVVQAKKDNHSISRLKILYVENLGAGELRKAACCNLSESFETNASVDVNITDAVSGAKKIQMMGLDGVYTQIQFENIPYLKGLESSFGLGSIPGAWMESIQITKGSGNVVNGYESMAGLVNLELKKPETMEALHVNVYGNRFGRSELNVNTGFSLGEKWSSGWLAHASTNPIAIDENADGFKDFPTGTTFALANRYSYEGKKMESKFGFNSNMETKTGGQTAFSRNDPNGAYGVLIDVRHIDVFAKTGFFLKKPLRSIGVVYNFKYEMLDAQFGNRIFDGEEKRGYVNAIYDGIFGNSSHKYKLGGGAVYTDIQQRLDSLNADRVEFIPGAFFEYTYTGPRLSAIAGVRGDYHSIFGEQVSPRLHLRYALSEYTDVRFAVGKGWRVPNYIVDNISLSATSRNWIAPDTIVPEISWNIGGSLVQRFKLFKRKGNFTVDFYHTAFENQMLVDRDLDVGAIIFTNLNGRSYSNALQAELSVEPIKNFEVRMAYKWLDVKATYGGVLQQKIMVPRHRGLVNLAYESRNRRWKYDLTASLFGESRLPNALMPDGSITSGEENIGQARVQLGTQITHIYRKWEFYIGGENLGNFTQRNPIIDAQNPFSPTFDATRIWGPVVGANVYVGLRFSIEQKKKEEHEDETHTGGK